MVLSMASYTSYDELLRENAALKERLAEQERLGEQSRQAEEQGRMAEHFRRVAAETALRESETRYRALADTMPQVVFIATASGFVEYVNRPGLEYIGLRLDEAIGFGWLGAIHPDDRQLVSERWLECLRIGKTYEFENRLLRADGHYRWQLARAVPIVGESGAIVRLIGTSTDIHDHRQAQQDLQQSRTEAECQAEELNRLYQTSPAGLAFLDTELRFVRINQTLAKINGFPPEAYIGRTFREMLSPAMADRLEPVLRLVVDEAKPAMNVEFEGEPPSDPGNIRYWLANYYPLVNREGSVLGVNVVMQDMTERKRTEEALQRSHAFIRQIIDTDPNFIFVKDRDGRFTLVNQTVADCYGTTVEELLGKTDADFNSNVEEVDQFRRKDREVLDGLQELFIAEEVITDASGSVRWLQTVKRPILGERGQATHILGVATDITQRRLAEEALRRNEELLRLVTDSSPIAMAYCDEQQRLRFVNRAYVDRFGLEPSQVLDKPIAEVIGSQAYDTFRAHIVAALRGTRTEFEAAVPYERIGTRYMRCAYVPHLDHQGRAIGFTAVMMDITDRRRMEEALRESEERLRLALAAGQMGAWDVDLATDMTRWDRKEFALLGLMEGSITPSTPEFYRHVHPDDLPLVEQSVQRALNGSTGALEHEFRVIRPDGAIRWLAAKGQVLNDHEGRPVRMVGVNFDVTERRRTEERLRSFTHELEARVAERTQELTQLHERLRALATELNLTEQRERKRLATDLHDYLTQLLALVCMKLSQIKRKAPGATQAEIAQTEGVVNEALVYTRTLVTQLSPPVLHEFGLPVALRWLAEQMIRQELTVEVRQSVPDQVSLPEDRAVLLFQSVRELLINVRKHARTNHALMTIEQTGASLCITVRDEGAGMDLQAAQSSQPSAMSSKFGLFSIRERMLAIGGCLEIESAPGRGMTSRLSLPLTRPESMDAGELQTPCQSQEDATLQHDERASPCQDGRIRVLLVDDHTIVREELRVLLYDRQDLLVVGEAGDGEQAVLLADKLRPDCVIMDVNMPRMDGMEATRRIKAAFADTAVIGISVNNSQEMVAAMRRAGADAFLSKEAPAEDIHHTIVTMTRKCA
jgi:PAS domain S-box-containing protein